MKSDFLKAWYCLYSNTPATMLDTMSLIGILHQMPDAPMKVGRMMRQGRRNSN